MHARTVNDQFYINHKYFINLTTELGLEIKQTDAVQRTRNDSADMEQTKVVTDYLSYR